ncbi:MAG TPA: hypothetical protein V6D22_26275 [Candidatus Obscuribacterales bacterium]
MAEADFEKLGVFYLGRRYDLPNHKLTDELCLYDSRDLLTHAVCIGMTGSGKTGLCLGLIEEALIDNIPVIAIDPKGDIGNLLLTFPQLRAEDFEPWIDSDEARRQSLSTSEFAARQAKDWKDGLAQWEETGDRIARLKSSADFAIYTPGSSAGRQVSIMSSFAMPPQAVLDDADALSDRLSSTASSLLGILGIDAAPLQSRDHILISQILKTAWTAGRDLSLPAIVQNIQKPPFTQIGALDVDAFYPPKERFELAMKLNNLLASPGFDAWSQGEPLSVERLLYTTEGKPRVSIFSIAHLDDQQRMFFVAILLNQILSWMRSQSGTSSLRAVFYMDEIFGYFPPTANPPSKRPLLTLMKQARAFGLGIVLATQNPVDIDYKGLSNAGTWFIGRLQTERDKLRVLDGLQGAAADAGASFDRATIDKILSQLGARVFLMNNVHDNQPTIFQTRWTLSYLRGPLTRDQIKTLTRSMPKAQSASIGGAAQQTAAAAQPAGSTAQAQSQAASMRFAPKPIVPPGIVEHYLPLRQSLPTGARLVYRAQVLGVGNVHFSDAKAGVDTTLQYTLLVPSPQMGRPSLDWDAAQPAKVWMEQLLAQPESGAGFDPLPPGLSDAKAYTAWAKEFVAWLAVAKKLKLLKSDATGEFSKPRESEGDFRVRLGQSAREKRDAAVEALKAKYGPKLTALQDKLRRAEQELETQQKQAHDQQMQSAISVGATVLGAFMGRRKVSARTIDRAASAARQMGRASREQQDVEHADETVQVLSSRLQELNSQFAAETAAQEGKFDPMQTVLSEVVVPAKKTNISVALLALVWTPYIRRDGAEDAPAWVSLSASGPHV